MIGGNGRVAFWTRRMWLLIGTVVIGLAACSADQAGSEGVGVATQLLTASQQRILGFESVGAGSTDWVAGTGSLSQSTRHVEGTGSLAIANSGNTTITSAALSALGPVADKITLDLLLPANQPNPYWMGTLKLVIECPSQQLWSEGLAEHQLQGKATDQFLRFEFPLSAATRQTLSTGTYADLRFKILLNVASGPGPWLLDRLWLGEPAPNGNGGSGGAGGSSGGSAGASGGGQSGSAGTSSVNDPILGFEAPTYWTTSAGVLESSETRVDGQHSVQLSNIAYAEITSKPLTTLGAVGPVIGFDISVPNPVGDVWWWGSAAVSIDCPSRGIYGRWLGQQELDGSTLDHFRRVEVMLPEDVWTTLSSGSYADLRVKIILTVPQGSGPYLLDRFTFAHQLPEPTPPGPSDALLSAIGFETLEAWKTTSGTLALSSNALEGSSSLALSNFTYAEVTSQRFSSLGAEIESPLTVNVWVPTPLGQWVGTIGLALDLPSKGINWQWIGQHDLASLTPETWHRLSFDLPQATIASLRSSYGDLRIKLLINRPEQLSPFLIDELNLGKLKPLPAAVVEDYVLPLPKGMAFANVAVGQALVKRSGFRLADLVFPPSGGPITVTSALDRVGNLVAPRMGRSGGDATVAVYGWLGDISAFLNVIGGPINGTAWAGGVVSAGATSRASGVNLESFEAGRIHVEYPADLNTKPDVVLSEHQDLRELVPGAYGFVTLNPPSDADVELRLRSGVYHLRGLAIDTGSTVTIDNEQGPVFIHVRDALALEAGKWIRTAPQKNNVLLTFAGRRLSPIVAFQGTFVAPRVELLQSGTTAFGARPIGGSFFARSVRFTDSATIAFHPFERDDCHSLPDNGCGVFGCDTSDADADGLYDCDEQPNHWADPQIFNGVHVRAAAACSAAGAHLCSAIDTLQEIDACMVTPVLEQNMYAGWSLGTRALQGIGCQDEMNFWPPWSKCTTEASTSFDYQGFIQLTEGGKHCFALPATAGVCGAIFVNGATEGITSASVAQCVDLEAGIYPIRWFIQAPAAGVLDRISVAYCFGGDEDCTATATIPQRMLRPEHVTSGLCSTQADCLTSQYCASTGHCTDNGSIGSGGCRDDEDCAAPLICGQAGGNYDLSRLTKVCTLPGCLTDPVATGCGYDGAPCASCEPTVSCDGDEDCPSGDVCLGQGSCGPPGCLTDPVATGCGTASDPCGECPCTPSCEGKSCGDDPADGCGSTCRNLCEHREDGCVGDADCPIGDACVIGGGPRIGLPEGTNVCLPVLCLSPGLRNGEDCGDVNAPCGLCAPVPDDVCADRECGLDPSYGVRCGPDGPGCIQGKLVGAFDPADLDLETLDRENGAVRSIAPLDAPDEEAISVGSIGGTFHVDARGNANYSIPIVVPPARAGVEPQIALVYNSGNRNGLVGMGWAIEGLSAIARCPKTAGTDGWAEPVKFDTSDALCLDGKRLVPLTDSVSSLTAGAQYRTELDSFEKIEFVGETKVGGFRVWRKDGLIYEYGLTENQRLYRDTRFNGRVTRAWALARIHDRIGNFANLEYRKPENTEPRTDYGSVDDTVEFWPLSIAYGGISNSGRGVVLPTHVVEFEYYDQRPDYMEGFTSTGSRIARSRLLKTIKTRIRNLSLRSYELTYEAAPSGLPEGTFIVASGPQRLASIEECSLKNGHRVCKRPTTFKYSDERGFRPNTHKTTVGSGGRIRGPLIDLDYNGDGARDILAQFDPDDGDPYWVILVATRSRLAESYTMVVPETTDATPSRLRVDQVCFSQASIEDLNGDGRDDVFDTCRKSGLVYNIWQSTGDDQLPLILRQQTVGQGYVKAPRTFLIDVDGDEVKDLFECGVKSTFDATDDPNPGYVEHAVYYRGRISGTFDSVGRGLTSRSGMKRGRGEGSLWAYCFGGPHFTNASDPNSPMFVQDVTGDGTGDLLLYQPRDKEAHGGSVVDDSGWGRYVVDSDGETGHWIPVAGGTPSGTSPFLFVDINGDGLRDWLSVKGMEDGRKAFQVSINKGGEFNPGSTYGGPNFSNEQAETRLSDFEIKHGVPLDYDGDGVQDLLSPLEPRGDDPADVRSLWLWNRAASGRERHGTLELDTATVDLSNASLRSLQSQPEVVPPDSGPVFNLTDADGDGSADLIQLDKDGKIGVHYGRFGHENLLTSVTDAVGQRVEIEYESKITQSDGTHPTYGSEIGCSHHGDRRTTCVKSVGPVVSSYRVIADPGAPYSATTDVQYLYRYENARNGLYGRGWLGFEKTIIEKLDQGSQVRLIQRTEITRDNSSFLLEGKLFPIAGMELSRVTTTPSAQSRIEVEAASQRRVVSQSWDYGTSASGGLYPFVRTSNTYISEVLRSGDVIDVSRRESAINEIDAYGNVRARTDIVFVGGRATNVQEVLSEFDDSSERIDAWLIALKVRESVEDRIIGTESTHDSEMRVTSWGYDDDGLLTETTQEPDEPEDSSLYLKTTFHRRNDDLFQNVRFVEQTGNWRDSQGEVVGRRVTSYQYDEEGLFPRRTIQHVGADCPVDPDLGDGDDEGLGTTCLLVDVRYDARDGTLLGSVDNAGVGSQSSFDSFGRVRRQLAPGATVTIAYEDAEPGFDIAGRLIPGTTQVRVLNETTGKRTVETYEALGRLVQVEKSGLDGDPVFQEYRYIWGTLVEGASRPHLDGDSSQGEVVNKYDGRYRLFESAFPDGTSVQAEQAAPGNAVFGYEPLAGEAMVSRVIDSRLHQTVKFSNFRGAPLRIVDANGSTTKYTYDAFGTLGGFEDALGNVTSIATDKLGRIVEYSDADTGVQSYQHTAFGEPFVHEDGVGLPTVRKRSYEYDAVGRLVLATAPEGNTVYEYDIGENAMGRLVQTTSPWDHVEHFDYQHVPASRDPMENAALLESVTREIAGETFLTSYGYDAQQQLDRVTYPESAAGVGFTVRYGYDSAGNVNTVTGTSEDHSNEDALFWRRDSAYQGQITDLETLGDELVTTYGFHPKNARLLSLTTGASANDLVQDIQYVEYDANGNLLHRTTGLKKAGAEELEVVDEGFHYDALDRLDGTRVGEEAATIGIDDIGNITSKPGVGTYVYSEENKPFRPHAVQSVKRNNVKVLDHEYDDFGNLSLRSGEGVDGGSQEIQYTSFNLPSVITFGDGRELRYEYDASDRRVLESIGDCVGPGSVCSERAYVGGEYERESGTDATGSFARHKYKVMLGARVLAEIVREHRDGDETEQRRFIHGDALGSPQVITDAEGAVVGSRRYGAFGERSDETGDATATDITRDFTGHQLDAQTGLVNMGGRLYDSRLGRFLQADPAGMESPFSSQGLNRYAYAFNNPVMATDPSGFQVAPPPDVCQGCPDYIPPDGSTPAERLEQIQRAADALDAEMAEKAAAAADAAELAQANALWQEISGEGAEAYDTGNPNMDLIGMPEITPGPLQLDLRLEGPGDRYNPYDYHRFGTSLFGGELQQPLYELKPGDLLFELHPASSIYYLQSPTATTGQKVMAILAIVPIGKLLKLGKVALAARGAAGAAEGVASRVLGFTQRNLQKGFTKHGADFGLKGNWNPSRAADFSRAINQHINDPVVTAIDGTYRGAPATHYFNPATGVSVIADSAGNYVSGWRLGVEQMENLFRSGAIW
jgi:RHS repeat-associated protein